MESNLHEDHEASVEDNFPSNYFTVAMAKYANKISKKKKKEIVDPLTRDSGMLDKILVLLQICSDISLILITFHVKLVFFWRERHLFMTTWFFCTFFMYKKIAECKLP